MGFDEQRHVGAEDGVGGFLAGMESEGHLAGDDGVEAAQAVTMGVVDDVTDPQPGSWSALWDVFIPTCCTEPLSALREEERTRIFDSWAKQSFFTRFGEWLAGKNDQGVVMD